MKLPWRPVCPVPNRIGPLILTSLTEQEATTLQDLAENKRVLEIGSANGFSAIVMASTADQVISIDPHTDVENSFVTMRENLKAYDCTDKVIQLVGKSRNVFHLLSRESFDLVFVDGDHSYDAVKYDIVTCLRDLLDQPGVLAVHDYGEESCPDVTRCLDELFDQPKQLVDTLFVVTK